MTDLVEVLIGKYAPAGEGGWVPAVVASRIAAELRSTPEGRAAVAAWLDRRLTRILTTEITMRKPRNSKGHRMAKAIDRAYFLQHSCPGQVVKVAHEMNADDHAYVAARHQMRSKTEGMLSRFHEAVAAKLGEGQITSDVFDAETYQQQLDSIS